MEGQINEDEVQYAFGTQGLILKSIEDVEPSESCLDYVPLAATSGRSTQTGRHSYSRKRRFGETSPTTRDDRDKLRRSAPASTEEPVKVVIDLTAYSSDEDSAESDSDCILTTEQSPSPLKKDATEPGTIIHPTNVLLRTRRDLLPADFPGGHTPPMCFPTNIGSSPVLSGPIESNRGPWRRLKASKSHALDATGTRRLANSSSPSWFPAVAWRANVPNTTPWNSPIPKDNAISRTHTTSPNFKSPSPAPNSSRSTSPLEPRKKSRKSHSGCQQSKNFTLDPPLTEKDLDGLLRNIYPNDGSNTSYEPTPSGLKFPLYPHQEVALAWMKKMETSPNNGGILADDMGLGKTISILALILVRSNECGPKTTLIVGPLSLLRQWDEEIWTKTTETHRPSVCVYHGLEATGNKTIEDLLRYDVVITTYGTVAQQLKRRDEFVGANQKRSRMPNNKTPAVNFPLLHPEKAVFWRVVLDEAQCIKNRDTETAKGCRNLKATYRWCLTGTPMMNGIHELYSYLEFLGIKPYHSWNNFRRDFGTLLGERTDSKGSAMRMLQALLKAVMLRRTKDFNLNGKPILQLPPKREHVVYASLSRDEWAFYKQLEQKAQFVFSKYLREGSVVKNYSNILVLLLRLRQACCHPHLNLAIGEAVAAVSEARSEELESPVKRSGPFVLDRIRPIEGSECPECYDAVRLQSLHFPCGHSVGRCGDCLSRTAENYEFECPTCEGVFRLSEGYTHGIMTNAPETEALDEGEPAHGKPNEGQGRSGVTHTPHDEVDNERNFEDSDLDAELPTIYDLKEEVSRQGNRQPQRTKEARPKEKSDERQPPTLRSIRADGAKSQKAHGRYMSYLRETWMPSAKVTECMRLLQQPRGDGGKTIVFSQWTLFLDLLEVAMWRKKLPTPIRYDGGMSGEQRSLAASKFQEVPGAEVMLASLRAGNSGLNLTAASRVIIMDPFWNPYLEMQAVDRAHRIGQRKAVDVFRILTQNTVEDRIVQLQKSKKEIVEAALDETQSKRIGHLKIAELKFLFNVSDGEA